MVQSLLYYKCRKEVLKLCYLEDVFIGCFHLLAGFDKSVRVILL